MPSEQGDCLFGWDLLGYYKMDRTFYSLFIAVRPFLFRGEMELEWGRGLRGDSRMCDPFCNNPANPIQTDSHLDTDTAPQRRRIPCESLNSKMGEKERKRVLADLSCKVPDTRFMYVTPEQCATPTFQGGNE